MSSDKVLVCARINGPSRNVLGLDHSDPDKYVTVRNPKEPTIESKFHFDHVFDHDAQQADVFELVGKNAVEDFVNPGRRSGTIFAYGCTGSGKTYTMTGGARYINRGLVPRALSSIFKLLSEIPAKNRPSCLISYLEVYEERVKDLLDNKACEPLEVEVSSEEESLELFFKGNVNRVTSGTLKNSFSSRSHCLFSIRLGDSPNKLNFVDLAGSEKWTVERDRETRSINLSLHYLEQVVLQITEPSKNKHICFRNCAITKLLSDSFSDSSKSIFVMTLDANSTSNRDSLSTCYFAQRCQRLKAVKQRVDKNDILVSCDQTSKKDMERMSNMIKSITKERDELLEQLQQHKTTMSAFLNQIDPIEDMLLTGNYFNSVVYGGLKMKGEDVHIWVSPCFSAVHVGIPRNIVELKDVENIYLVTSASSSNLIPSTKCVFRLKKKRVKNSSDSALEFQVSEQWASCFSKLMTKYETYNHRVKGRKDSRLLKARSKLVSLFRSSKNTAENG